MQANKKDLIAAWSAVGMLVFGVIITGAGFIVPPLGEVHDSVLWILGQILIYAGSIFGITMYAKSKLTEIENKVNNHLNKKNDEEVKEDE